MNSTLLAAWLPTAGAMGSMGRSSYTAIVSSAQQCAPGRDTPHRDDGHVGDGTDTGTSRPWVLRSDPSGGQPEGVVLVPLEEGAIMSR